MARINARDFVGTRCRLQRLRDAKVFNGWIESFFGTSLDVSTSTEASVQIGDEFRIEGFGHHIAVVMTARVEDVGVLDMLNSSQLVEVVEGTNARIIEVRKSSLKFVVSGPLRFSASPESVRLLSPDLPVAIGAGPREVSGIAVDVSPNGMGCVSTEQIEPGSQVAVTVTTPGGSVRAQALVRYCRKDADRQGHFRFGLMFTDMGRVERPRWEKFISEIS